MLALTLKEDEKLYITKDGERLELFCRRDNIDANKIKIYLEGPMSFEIVREFAKKRTRE